MIYKIKEIAVVKRGSSPRPINDFIVPEGFPWLKISDFSLYDRYVYKTKEFIKEEGLKNTRYVKKGSLIVTNSATPGIPIFLGEDMCLHDGFLYFDEITEKVNKVWLYYYLIYIRKNLVSLGNGSVFVNLKKEILEEHELELPPLHIQNKIADIMSNIDDKIQINNEIINNLEEQIKTIYANKIKGCSECVSTKIGELDLYITDYVANGSFATLKENVTLYSEPNYAYFIRNTDLKSGLFETFVDEHSYKFLSKSVLYGNEIIVSNVGDIGSVFLCPKLDKPMTLGNNVILIKTNNEEYKYFMYSWFKWFDGKWKIQSIKGGSAVPKFNKTEFKNLEIELPIETVIIEFNNIVKEMFELIYSLETENKELAILRNTLIKQIYSTEIDLENIEL